MTRDARRFTTPPPTRRATRSSSSRSAATIGLQGAVLRWRSVAIASSTWPTSVMNAGAQAGRAAGASRSSAMSVPEVARAGRGASVATAPPADGKPSRNCFGSTPLVGRVTLFHRHQHIPDVRVAADPEFLGRDAPDGHLKLLHLWPGQTPPPRRRDRVDFSRLTRPWQRGPRPPSGASSCPRT